MLKNIALAVASLLVTSEIAVANPLSAGASLERLLPKNAARSADCAQLDGLWAGQCTVTVNGQDQTAEDVREIRQYGCDLLVDGGTIVPIGGLKDQSLSFPYEGTTKGIALGISEAADWNKDKTGLTVHTVFQTRAIGSGSPVSFAVDSTLRRDGEKLYAQGATTGQPGDISVKVSCDYTKE